MIFNMHQKTRLIKKNITCHFVPSTDLLAMHLGADNERLTKKDEVKKGKNFSYVAAGGLIFHGDVSKIGDHRGSSRGTHHASLHSHFRHGLS